MRLDAHVMKKLNKASILSLVIKHPKGVSRIDLTKLTGFSKSTVSMLTEELLEEGLIVEGEMGSSTKKGGRKPIALLLNEEVGVILSVIVKKNRLMITSGKINGQLMQTSCQMIDKRSDDFLNEVKKKIKDYITAEMKNEKIIGIGISVPGLVSTDEKMILHSPELEIEKYNLKDWAKELSCPIFPDNDVNMTSVGENSFGMGRIYKDFVQLSIGTGIGGAIIIDHKIYKGSSNSAGELGYMAIGEEKEQVTYSYNQFGWFESLYSLKSLETKYQMSLDTILENLDEKKKEDIVECSKGIARGIASVVSLLNPQAVVLNGRYNKVKDLALSVLENEVARITPIPVDIKFSELSTEAEKLGAIATVMSQVYGVTYL